MTVEQARFRYLFLLGLRWFPVGLTIPVLVLLPLERGLSIAQVGAVAAIQGFTVLVLELPTGGLSDALGRRPVLLIAGVVNLASLAIWSFADSVALFAVVYLLQGIYRALDSGPLEAWYVDHALAADPKADIEGGLSRSGVVLGLAIAGAALISGGLVWLGPIGPVSALTVPVLVALGLSLISTIAVALLMTEERPARGLAALATSVRGVPVAIGGALRLVRRSRVVLALILVEFFWSVGMVTFEKLMAVRLSEITSTDTAGALLGPVNSAAWAASAAGAALVPLLTRRVGPAWAGFTLKIVQGVTIVGMGLFAGPAGVIGAFLLCYAVHGAANPVHAGLLHRQAEGEYRTSLLSLNSMVGQPGFSLGAIVLTAVAAGAGTPTAIVVGGIVLAAAAPLYLVRSKEVFREHSQTGTSRSLAL
ncbi:putative MFS transporter [Actinoplanes missouriensis 431]|uniref:Putative MFS transporter n=1 Tax=Actinoplanes missouriensis (strain ATCC 14538 / DSM 43046 / CBS 188.64 / JCM 3121 / NBRC 102363 / NCIMB 12654 / NRRL B-3342 / UNCC 431) TaxID=512565 RepID=I0HEM2_ACTM4|nr:MFS transporter [Actinoplanes missouriensis]BAL91459.1 putative MFS transporter [Actinoplanes missouriensis 431]